MPARSILSAALALGIAGCATLPSGASEEARLFAKLDRCGLETRSGKVRYDPVEALVVVTPPATLNARGTQCVARLLLDRGLDFQTADIELAAGYAAAWERANAALGPRMAQRWIRKNVKRPVPRYAPRRETLDAYVRKLERLCAAEPGSVTATADTVRVPWLKDEAANDKVSCVYLAALASNLAANGVRVESVKETPEG